ncbi:MAG: MerR family transcriptional regulator [Actinomycetota bacterium]
MATRNYLSIGEVLVGLKAEFPDITISKIRFLESEGLIHPERTPSGYRKFYEGDLETLRGILRMQRDEYLPLKVIKERLAEGDGSEPAPPVDPEEEAGEALAESPTGLQMTLDEMSSATGVEEEQIKELESYGIVCTHGPEGAKFYDGDDYVVLSIVKDFYKYGIGARHLRMYQHFAERESNLFESVVMPVLRQRNPDARKTAANSLTDLAKLSRKLKQALLRTKLRQYLSS